jgi:glycosyltransferase involved in cell wall biosynthesis
MSESPLRIAMVAPLFESVPPRLYGGTERFVSWLTEELVRQGHFVTLFASGDSRTRARLRAPVPCAIRLDPGCKDPWPAHVLLLDELLENASHFDVIHFNTEHWHLPFCRRFKLPALSTMHGRLDLPELVPLYRRFLEAPLVSISDAQRSPLEFANWVATVHHGLPPGSLKGGEKPGSYLAFLGRISPEKGPERAIRIARRAGIPLRIAAKVDKADQEYYEAIVKPELGAGGGVEYIGEIADKEKSEFLGNALALLFPIDWPEPFGLVMIESMACGTPVIAYRRGSVPEILEDGVTARLVENEDEAVAAARDIGRLDRKAIRRMFEKRFTVQRMASDYVELYRGIHEVNALAQRVLAARTARSAAADILPRPSRVLAPEDGWAGPPVD